MPHGDTGQLGCCAAMPLVLMSYSSGPADPRLLQDGTPSKLRSSLEVSRAERMDEIRSRFPSREIPHPAGARPRSRAGIRPNQNDPRRDAMIDDMERRDFIKAAGLVAGAGMLAAAGPSASAQSPAPAPVKAMVYEAKPMTLNPRRVRGLSEKILMSHYDNNYTGAVKRLNAIAAQLAGLDLANAPSFVLNGLKREELIAMNSMILHELYFDGLGGNGDRLIGNLATAIARDFGSLERWRA